VAGIELALDWSLVIIFWLVALSLAAGVLPRWHPRWGAGLTWAVALAAAVLFFLSVLCHELAHALVGRAFGVPVRRITLFIFGGLAELRDEPPSARAELLIALAGPLASAAIGGVSLLAGRALAGPALATAAEPLGGLQSVGPAATLLLWLGPVNLVLGLFNLVPGFPLDGGRVLRAVLWAATRDLVRATRWAALVGRAFAWLLMGLGVAMAVGLTVPLLGTGFVNGLWLVLIGWFLGNAAQLGYEQVLQRDVLRGVTVERLMCSQVETVPADLPIAALVDEHLLHSDQRSFPVVERERMVGLIGLEEVRLVPRALWRSTPVGEAMTPLAALTTIAPDEDASRALGELASLEVSQLPVVDGERLLGVVRRQDIMKWLTLRGAVG